MHIDTSGIRVPKRPRIHGHILRETLEFFFKVNNSVARGRRPPIATRVASEKGSIFRARVGTVPYALNIFRSIDETMKIVASTWLHKRPK